MWTYIVYYHSTRFQPHAVKALKMYINKGSALNFLYKAGLPFDSLTIVAVQFPEPCHPNETPGAVSDCFTPEEFIEYAADGTFDGRRL